MHREFVFSLATCSANHTLYSLYLLCGAFGLELSIRDSDSSHFVEPVMAFMKADSFATLKSRAWSTSELAEGLGHILTDGRLEEVDDVAPFQELEGILADLEAKQSTDAAMQELMAEPAQAAPPGEH
ncbi:unnamed protein product [Durusdinium trenchii]|uniref:Uncharacterized protein n=1 Tax=Durusdinium trenchii TaxID=1381693 RepID=A0ABP0M2X0_9DINO